MMTASREVLLESLSRSLSGTEPDRSGSASNELSRVELGLIFNGLSQAISPIRAAAAEVTDAYNLAPRGAFILSLIAGGIVHPLDLAVALGIRPSLATAELQRLIAAGLVCSGQDAVDRRKTVLGLTASGQLASDEVFQAMTQTVLENLRHYSLDEIRLFARMLRDVRKGCPADPL